MSRTIKLVINFFVSSIVFTYFVVVLLLLLNQQAQVSFTEFFLLFINLYVFYGPLWFVFTGIFFLVIQFFSEKKYPIGFFTPPTLTYFFSFTFLIIAFILYLNYDYYFSFLEGNVKSNFIQLLLINLALVITGIVFVFFNKKINKKWIQAFFISLMVFYVFYSYFLLVIENQSGKTREYTNGNVVKREFPVEKFTPRKIKIVLMDSLSLNLLDSLTSEQKLLNFNEIIQKGVSGEIDTFKPNLSLSMLNSALTGLRPSQLPTHSYEKFTFADVDYEFDVRPRYIFFRKSPFIKIVSFHNRNDSQFLDNIKWRYEADNRKTARLIRPSFIDTYSPRALNKNNRFVMLFSDLVKNMDETDEKHDILKKSFFLDDYIKNLIPNLTVSDIYYSVIQLPGLDVISKYFYQYSITQGFGGISQDDLKIRKYEGLLEKYYEYYDSIIGNLMSATGDNELLVILSFYEYEPLPLWRRILVNLFGQKDVYVYVSPHSKGAILLYEKNALKKGYPLKNISIFDIYPTLLYYSGFQLSTDVQGDVLKEIFTDEFLWNNPIELSATRK